MNFLIDLIVGWGVPAKAAKIVLFTIGAALLIAVMAGGKCAYDKSIVTHYADKVDASAAKADRKADEAAAVQRRVDDTRLTQEQAQLEKVQTNAKDPQQRRRDFYRCLGLQQAARADGRQPPTCV